MVFAERQGSGKGERGQEIALELKLKTWDDTSSSKAPESQNAGPREGEGGQQHRREGGRFRVRGKG